MDFGLGGTAWKGNQKLLLFASQEDTTKALTPWDMNGSRGF
jgi:hypothetical protein